MIHTSNALPGTISHVGQVFFTDRWTDVIAMTSPYNQNKHHRVLNAQDSNYATANSEGYNAIVEWVTFNTSRKNVLFTYPKVSNLFTTIGRKVSLVTLVSCSVARYERQILSVLNSCGSEPTEEGWSLTIVGWILVPKSEHDGCSIWSQTKIGWKSEVFQLSRTMICCRFNPKRNKSQCINN